MRLPTRLTGALLAVILVASCSSSSDVRSTRSEGNDDSSATAESAPSTDASDDSGETSEPNPSSEPATEPSLQPGSVTAPDVPAPPPVPPAPAGDPTAQAAALATATTPGAEGVEAAWLAAYDLARIPVLDGGSGLGSTGDDPLGPGWWEVWMVSGGAAPSQGMPLADVLKIVVSPDEQAASDEDAASAASAFINDLRTGVESGDPTAVFTASFIDAKAQQAGTPVSLLDPALDLATTTIDTATAHLLVWVALRAEAWTYGADGASVSGLRSDSRPALRRSPPPPQACSQLWGTDQATWVTNWVTNKVLGGATLPGLQMKGLLEKIAELNPHIVSAEKFAKFAKVTSQVNALTSVASAVMQYAALDLASAGDPLDRTRTTTNGKEVTLRFDILLNPEKLPDGNSKALSALSFLLNGLGVSFSFPSSGFLAGVEVVFTGTDGFGDRVLFGDFEQMKQDTDASGSAYVLILGKAQSHTIPETAPRVRKEYTLEVEATPEPIDGNSLFNAMFDGLVFTAAPNPLSALALSLDIMKTAHWDLGEQIFEVQDWQSDGYAISGTEEGVSFTGTVCDFSHMFTATGSGNGATVVVTFEPSSANGGFWTYTGSGGGVALTGAGGYTVILGESGGSLDMSGAGQAGGASRGWVNPLVLTPTTEGC